MNYAKSWARQLAINTLVLSAFMVPSVSAIAQTVVAQPAFIGSQRWIDLGNGPVEVQPIEGNGDLYTSFGTGVGSTSGSSTTLTLTATPAVAPCVGCIISGAGITSGTTVAAFNGTTTVTLSAAMTVAASTALAWGAACPAATAIGTPGVSPNTVASLGSPAVLRAGQGTGYPMYTQGRICVYAAQQSGFTFLYFAIGAH